MMNGWEVRRECRVEVVADGVVDETLPFPVEVVMVCDDGITCLGYEFGDGQTKRDIDRNCEGIFDDERFRLEDVGEFVEMFFEVVFKFLDLFCNVGGTDVDRKVVLIQLFELRVEGAGFMVISPGAGEYGLGDRSFSM